MAEVTPTANDEGDDWPESLSEATPTANDDGDWPASLRYAAISVKPPALPVAAPPVVAPAEPAPAPEPTPETPTANDDEGDAVLAPRALPVAPPSPPVAETPANGAEDDGEIRRLLATLAHERRRHDQLEVRL